ncbi:MAG: cation transporter [Planctomycetes bacterium]|nr:cation transporter [Planctomycetota bacterium]MCC7062311.1 cation transporter [Planctomycetota bacterium]
MNAPAASPMKEQNGATHTWVALLSLGVAVVLLCVKFWAYAATGSQAVFGDALESIVNVVAAAFAFGVLSYAGRPADRDHPFGHGKIEFFSAVFEGGLISFAALLILWQAGITLYQGANVREIDFGLVLTVLAGLGNGALGLFLVRYGRAHRSVAIEADGHHVLSDFWTSAGVVVGLLLVRLTGLVWLDPVAAGLMAIWLLLTGWRLVRRAAGGLLDEEDPELLKALAEVLTKRMRDGVIRVHHLRAIRAGRFHHVSAHLVVPEFWTVERAHDTAEALAASVMRELPGEGDITFHTDPCERAYCRMCDLEACSVRVQPFLGLQPLTVDEAVRPDPSAHSPSAH